MKIGFIGCGNMAKPIIRGVIKNGLACCGDVYVYVYDIRRDDLTAFCADAGATAVYDYSGIIEVCELVVLAVKPQTLPEVLTETAAALKERRPLIVSIAAGKTTEYIASFLDYDAAVGRIFPNLNAEVKQAVSAYCVNAGACEKDREIIKEICETFGSAIELDESLFSVFGVLSGCAPAYTFMYIGALAKAAGENGLDADLALEVACLMAQGSAATLKHVGVEPEEMIRRVCSPGGTTIEGINYLRENGFEDTVKSAFRASYEKDKSFAIN